MGQLTQWLMDSIRAHGTISVFLGVMIESIIVPIPSPLIIMGAGAILVPPGLPWAQTFGRVVRDVVLPGSIASTAGAFIGYGLGYWGGKPAVERLERFLGFGWSDVEAMERRLIQTHAGLMILLLRALPIVPLSLISIAVGIIRWPVASFTWWTWLGSVPRCLVLGYLGWAMRDAYHGFAYGLDRIESLVSVALIAVIVGVVLWLRRRMGRA